MGKLARTVPGEPKGSASSRASPTTKSQRRLPRDSQPVLVRVRQPLGDESVGNDVSGRPGRGIMSRSHAKKLIEAGTRPSNWAAINRVESEAAVPSTVGL